MSFLLREVRPDSTASYSDDPNGTVNDPNRGTIAEKRHKGTRGQKRRHAVTVLQALDLRVTPE